MNDLEKYRSSVIEGLKKARKDRRYTQAEFAKLLGCSQQQYSKIERGEGSISAEQLLLILNKFVLSLSDFVEMKPKEKDEALVLQNALARLGAIHLREIQGVFIPEKLTNPNEAIFETLGMYQSSRLISALSPVIVNSLQRVNFNVIEKKLRELGHENRLWWVLENTLAALQNRLRERALPRDIQLKYRRAAIRLEEVKIRWETLEHLREMGKIPKGQEDIFDEGVTTRKTLANLKLNNEDISNKWNIITRLKKSDFEEALKGAEAS